MRVAGRRWRCWRAARMAGGSVHVQVAGRRQRSHAGRRLARPVVVASRLVLVLVVELVLGGGERGSGGGERRRMAHLMQRARHA
jgi:hypothetical protein